MMLYVASLLTCCASFGRGLVSFVDMPLQRSETVNARTAECRGADCETDDPHEWKFKSNPLTMGEDCGCCWRDCDELEDTQMHRHEMHASASQQIDDPGDVDVWMSPGLFAHRDILTPLWETVKHGLRNKASKFQSSTDYMGMRAGVAAAVAKGKQPLVIASMYFKTPAPQQRNRVKQLKELQKLGAYVVAYQTEPYGGPRALAPWLRQLQPNETWDYAMANVAQYPPDLRNQSYFVPPSYAPSLEVGVNLQADARDEGRVGYMGHNKPILRAYQHEFGGRITWSNAIRSVEDLRVFLERFPMQLNVHKHQSTGPRAVWELPDQHLESFRFADLLSNKACVISAPGSKEDNEKWASVVHIVKIEDTLKQFQQLAANIKQCQLATYERFKNEFDAEKVIQNSGFFGRWSLHPKN